MSKQHNVVFLDRASVDANVRRPGFSHEWTEYPGTDPDGVKERLANATIAITNKVSLRADVLEQLPNLKLIAVAATGTDVIDTAACKKLGITVSNIRNYATETLPEHTFALILALRRNLIAYRNDVLNGKWQTASQFCLLDHPIQDLAGSKIGIVGFGSLGKSVATLALAFGMEVIAFDPSPITEPGVRGVSLDEIIETADIISLHLPLTAETRNMIGANELARMKPGALLINTARGGLVDEAALATALKENKVAAGFDVLTTEPPTNDNPLVNLNLPNFILTPHVAWASKQAMQKLADQLIDNVEAFEAGRARNVVC